MSSSGAHRARARMEVRALRTPLAAPFKIATATVTAVDHPIVHAVLPARSPAGHAAAPTDVTGLGEATVARHVTGDDAASIRAALMGALTEPELWYAPTSLDDARTRFGYLPRPARAAWEGALLDALARTLGLPLWRLLQALPRSVPTDGPAPTSAAPEAIPARSGFASTLTIPLVPKARLKRVVEAALDAGYEHLKVKAGLGVERDLERIALVRTVAGDLVQLRVDVNQGWDLRDARGAAPALADLGVAWLEQPLARDALAEHADLRRHLDTPVMLDESVHTAADIQRVVDAGAADAINVKLTKAGGPLEALAVADAAQAAGLPCMMGCMVESRVAVLHALHVAAAHPSFQLFDLDGHTFLERDLVVGGPVPERGVWRMTSDVVGLGLDRILDESAAG